MAASASSSLLPSLRPSLNTPDRSPTAAFLRLPRRRLTPFPACSTSVSLAASLPRLQISASSAPVMEPLPPRSAVPKLSTVVEVDLGDRSYPIYIGSGLLNEPDLLQRHVIGKRVLVVTNTTVAPLYLDKVTKALTHGNSEISVESVILPDGEKYKNMDTLMKVFDKAIESRMDRRCTFVALGGGVIGDMCGFAAASFLRGVNFIQIPTTLMAQVDSSVGGKTGINHPLGKNLIGAFYQPQSVLIDTDTLNTLPERELASGIAEVVKYGLIRDAEFFEWQEKNMQALLERRLYFRGPGNRLHQVPIGPSSQARPRGHTGPASTTTGTTRRIGHAQMTQHVNRDARLPHNSGITQESSDWSTLQVDIETDMDPSALAYAIKRSCENKAEVVSLDEKESGVRATLNLGHTFGHAIETGVGYGEWLHGEAVAAGTVMAVDLSHRMGWIDQTIVERVLNILQQAKLPIAPPEMMTVDKFKAIMAVDKKVADGLLRLILLKGPLGGCVFTGDYDRKAVDETLHAFCKS